MFQAIDSVILWALTLTALGVFAATVAPFVAIVGAL
jgi:hypothetical protein